jgi:plastocyanin
MDTTRRHRAPRRSLVALAIAVVLPLTIAACGDDGGGADSDAGNGAGGGGGATEANVIVIDDVAFATPDVTIAVGDTITFDNKDNQPHTATSDTAFDTETLRPGETSEITFDEAGSFAYFCAFHPFMKGTVTVE